ncbi:acyl-CoA dehydrogenase family protein [Novosphingobium sp.]|uniref:acyl-CoA dehydrogenase family protein n=1 Tax=Novosphingobium sp. TaxID=1874826 RepID=UPI0035B24859
MQFEAGEEQQQLRSGLDRLLAQANDLAARTATLRGEPGWRPELWQRLAQDLGVLGVGLPETLGGFGGGFDQLVVMEAAGRALLPEPLAETLFQCAPLLGHGGAAAQALAAEVIAGDVRLAMALGEAGLRDDLAAIAMPAMRNADGWTLTGEKQVVVAAPWATHLLVPVRTGGAAGDAQGLSLFVVPVDASGLTLHEYRMLDERRAADVTFAGVQVGADALIGPEGGALALLDEWRDRAVAAASAEASGLLERLVDDTVAYARQREQFGQKIGSFQALQHRMVDMHLQLELVRSAALLACQSLDGDSAARARAASAARITTAQACRFIGQNAVQLHGGMGMTDELAIGHYFKRATVIERSFGSENFHLARRGRLDG